MIERIKRTFALTESGARGVVKASIASFGMYFAYMLPVTLVMLFVQDYFDDSIRGTAIYLGIMAALSVIMYLLINITYKTTYNETYKEAANLRVEIAEKLKELPLSYFSKHDLSDLSQTVMSDVADIEHALSHAIPEIIGFTIFFIIIATMLVVMSPLLGFVLILPLLIGFIFMIFTRNYAKRCFKKHYVKLRDNSELFQETIEMHQEIKSYGQSETYINEIYQAVEDAEKIHIRSEFGSIIPNFFANTVIKFCVGITIVVGSILFAEGHISLLYLCGYVIASARIMDGFASITGNLLEVMYIDGRVNRIREISNAEIQQGEECRLGSFDIVLKDVSFGYSSEKNVVDSISFVARQNEVTALVGPSGCGKTTLLRLMSRLYDYNKGEILIDGRDIKTVDTDSLFDKISIVFQDVTLFNSTIMENIRLGRADASDDEVIKAAKLANCHEFIEKLQDGYATMIGENGMKLSGGERQRISIARAFLKNSPIILLDEISASLDVENEMTIQDSLNSLIKNKTVVIISHRLKSIEKADKIVVMNEGKLEACGSYDELLEKSPTFALMVERANMTENFTY